MRSVSAFVKPSSAAMATTAASASAGAHPAAADRNAYQAIGNPSAPRNAAGEPNTQNA